MTEALNRSGSYLLEGKKAEALDARIMERAYDSKTELLNENPNPPAMLGRME